MFAFRLIKKNSFVNLVETFNRSHPLSVAIFGIFRYGFKIEEWKIKGNAWRWPGLMPFTPIRSLRPAFFKRLPMLEVYQVLLPLLLQPIRILTVTMEIPFLKGRLPNVTLDKLKMWKFHLMSFALFLECHLICQRWCHNLDFIILIFTTRF